MSTNLTKKKFGKWFVLRSNLKLGNVADCVSVNEKRVSEDKRIGHDHPNHIIHHPNHRGYMLKTVHIKIKIVY